MMKRDEKIINVCLSFASGHDARKYERVIFSRHIYQIGVYHSSLRDNRGAFVFVCALLQASHFTPS